VAILFKVFTTLLPDSLMVFGGSASAESSSFGFVPGSLSTGSSAGLVPFVVGSGFFNVLIVLNFPAFGSLVSPGFFSESWF